MNSKESLFPSDMLCKASIEDIRSKISKANPDELNRRSIPYKSSLIHEACYKSRHDVAELLLEAGADPTSMEFDHTTPLHIASQMRVEKMVRLLLSYGADPAISTIPVALISFWRRTPWEVRGMIR